jgi:FAD-dependent oxidoreductase family protein
VSGYAESGLLRASLHYATRHADGLRAVQDKSQLDEVPFRGLVARDVRGLLAAGRCLSGDFWAHSSDRVAGNAAAAGVGAAAATAFGRLPHELSFSEIADPWPSFSGTAQIMRLWLRGCRSQVGGRRGGQEQR